VPNDWTCVFLRKAFTVQTPALVSELHIDATYDDGFILWINGQEVARVNMNGAPGDEPSFDDYAASNVASTWNGILTKAGLPPLNEGTNIAAAQVFNRSVDSSDLWFDLELQLSETSTLDPADDADGDGMADAWEPGGDTTPNADGDSDGLTDLGEYIAGTLPGSADSIVAVDVRLWQDNVLVSMPTIQAAGTGYSGLSRYYALEQCPVGAGTFTVIPGYERILGLEQTIVYTNTAPASATTFYRGRVWLE
jgi:hypothetical protein